MTEDDLEDLAVLLGEAAESGVGGPHARDRVGRGGAGGIDGGLQARDRLLDDGVEQRVLGREVQVEGADADVGRGRDVGHLGVVEPLPGQHADGRRQEIAPRPLAPPLDTVRRRHPE